MRKVLRNLLQEKGTLCGCFVQIPSPELVEMCRDFDYVIIDYEHGHITHGDLVQMVRAAESVDLAVMVHIPEIEERVIGQVLDLGVTSLLVSNVSSVEDARRLVQLTHYHPEGTRGACPFTRANYYSSGLPGDVYYRKFNEDLFVIATIENTNGVREMEEIISTDGIDALGVGMFDLSVSMGIPGQVTHPEIQGVIDTAVAAARKRNKIFTAMVMSPEEATTMDKDVIRLIMSGSPESVIQNYLRKTATSIRKAIGNEVTENE